MSDDAYEGRLAGYFQLRCRDPLPNVILGRFYPAPAPQGYRGKQRHLARFVDELRRKGYDVSYAKGKALVTDHDWDGIGVRLTGLVCVDFDCMFYDIGHELPPTWKERSPNGLHLFYRLRDDVAGKAKCKIKWKPGVDLLVPTASAGQKYGTREEDGGMSNVWGGHVIVAPTPGYVCVNPSEAPMRDQLPFAPAWLEKALTS